jgi:hypothetical protein
MAENNTILIGVRTEPTSNPPSGKVYFWVDSGEIKTKDSSGTVRTFGAISDAVLKEDFDAKGDLIVGTANDTITNLSVGNNGDYLVADSTETSGMVWQEHFNNKYKIVYKNANYTLDRDDQVVITYQTTDITITLPDLNNFPNDGTGREYAIINLGNTGSVTLACASGNIISNGLSNQKVPYRIPFRLAGAYPTLGNAIWVRMNLYQNGGQWRRSTTWASGNFSSWTSIPWLAEDKNLDSNIFDWSLTSNNERVTIKVQTCVQVAFWGGIDSTGGSSYSVRFRLLKNGTEVAGSLGTVGNYQTEDSHFSVPKILVDCDVNDYLEVQLDQNSLTGNADELGISICAQV